MDKVWQVEDPTVHHFDFWARKYRCPCKGVHVKRIAAVILIISVFTVLYSIVELIVNGIAEWDFENILRILVIPIEVFCTVWLYEGLKLNLRTLILPYILFTLIHPILFAYLAVGEITGYSQQKGDAHDFAKSILEKIPFFDTDPKDVEQRRHVIMVFAIIHVMATLMNVVFFFCLSWCYKYMSDLERSKERQESDDINDFRQFQKRGSTGSFTEEARSFTKRASQMIIEVPVERIKQIKRTTGANSMAREIQHFVEINHTTGDFSENLLDYLIQYNYEVHNLFSNNDATLLDKGQAELNVYMQKHPNFTVMDFFRNGGFVCRNMLKICTFAGVEFDCCKYTAPIYTDLGKCFLINTTNLPDSSMHRQTAAGVNSGLQIILDAHLEEQFDGTGLEPQPIFTNALENGFRYYIHPSNTIPHVVSEGISVSPGANVYSALTVSNYELLDKNGWGNCTNTWPPGFNSNLPYASSTCASLCKARFFEEKCGCTPFVYNVDGYRKSCMPNETYTCIDQFGTKKENGRSIISLPRCAECQIECSTWNYASFNSYGQGFSNGAVKWIQLKNQADSNTHIRSNYVALNVFFRDMIYTKYIQQKGTSLTEILSDMGGNMGMWLGMSVLTFFEALIFLSKITWIFISKKRRMYMHEKKQQEQDKEKEMENTMSQLRSINKMDDNLDEETASTLEKNLEKCRYPIEKRKIMKSMNRENTNQKHKGTTLWKAFTTMLYMGMGAQILLMKKVTMKEDRPGICIVKITAFTDYEETDDIDSTG
ncbi:unnamed protein product, partial [Mesorhabditis spiculigera]